MKIINLNSLWIKLDYSTLEDNKVVKLISEFGDEGFGIYIKLILLLARNGGEHCLDYDIISYKVKSNKEIIESIINKYDLFKIDNENFYSIRLNNDLEDMKERSKKRQESGRKGGLANKRKRK